MKIYPRSFGAILAVIAMTAPGYGRNEETALIETGTASIAITPSEPIRLSGYRTRRQEASEVAGQLWAKALAFGRDDENPAVLITADLIGVPRELTDRVAKRLGLDRAQLAVCATHTHSGPFVKGTLPHIFGEPIPTEHREAIDRYAARLEEKLVQVAREALANREPAYLSWNEGEAGFAKNRRARYVLGRQDKNGRSLAPVDHDLPALFVHRPDGKLRAVLLNYACHCTTVTGEFNQFHGDWAGVAARLIQDRHPGAMALVAIGCGADQNPHPRGSLDLTERHGREIADEIDRLLEQARNPLPSVPACRYGYASLPFSEPPTESDLQERLQSNSQRVRYYAQILLDRKARGIEPPESLEYPVQVWSFGDRLAMIFLAGEVVVDYSLRLKRDFAGNRLWINAYANAAPCYIASARVIKEGGYEVVTSMDSYDKPTRLDPAAEERLIDKVRELLPDDFIRAEN